MPGSIQNGVALCHIIAVFPGLHPASVRRSGGTGPCGTWVMWAKTFRWDLASAAVRSCVTLPRANPGRPRGLRTILEQCFATWRKRDRIPAIHFSTQLRGQRLGAHAEYVDPEEFLQFYQEVGDMDFDCMLEAKAKDLALLSPA